MIQNARKFLEDNIKSINSKIKYFCTEIEKILLFDNNNINNINIKEINNNFMYDSSFNHNYNNKYDFDISQFQTINYSIKPRKKIIEKIKNKSLSNIKLESKYSKYLNSKKTQTDNISKVKQISLDANRVENTIFNKDIYNIRINKSRNPIRNQIYIDSTNVESTISAKNIK
jgi:hypothetical protein